MLRSSLTVFVLLFQLVFASQVFARDFDWLNQLSIEAQADPSGFVARLSTRFHIGNTQVETVIDNIGNQADAYMVFRLAEMSHRPVTYVTERYRANRHQGWGVLAKQLGIKPGSREFHALKAGHDLGMEMRDDDMTKVHGHGHGKGNRNGNQGPWKHGRDKD